MEKAKVEELIEKAKSLGLSGVGFLSGHTVDEVSSWYNGIGPQFLPCELRDKVTDWLGLFEPAAMIHDMRFEMSDGSREMFDFANGEFYANCRKCADAAYGWLNWRRYRAYAVAELMNEFVCGLPGWKAWTDAHEANMVK